jgi:hypothetical protein
MCAPPALVVTLAALGFAGCAEQSATSARLAADADPMQSSAEVYADPPGNGESVDEPPRRRRQFTDAIIGAD